MSRKRSPTDVPRPVPHLADAVAPKLRNPWALFAALGKAGGASFRGMETQLRYAPHLPSRSSSSLHRDAVEGNEALLAELNGRRLDDVDLAAVMIDGTDMGGHMLVWALGITHDGVKIPLGVVEGPGESTLLATELVSRLGRRGLQLEHLLWVVDGSDALRSGIRRATHGRAAIQGCQVHLQRGVLKKLGTKAERERLFPELSEQLKLAWSRSTPERALEALEQTARWLEREGHAEAAATLRNGADSSVTLLRLRLTSSDTKRRLRSTNAIESPHTGVTTWERRVSRWKPGMRDRAFAGVVANAEIAWQLVAERTALQQVSLAVVTGRHQGAGRWADLVEGGVVVAQLPGERGGPRTYAAMRNLLRWADRQGEQVTLSPQAQAEVARDARLASWLAESGFEGGVRAPRAPGALEWAHVGYLEFAVDRVVVPADDAAARERVSGALGLAPDAEAEVVCHGSAEALAAFGLADGEHATMAQLAAAAGGRHVGDGRQARAATPRPLFDAAGARTGSVRGVVTVTWELTPPPELTQRWLEAGAAERAQIERALAAGAEAAIGEVVDGDKAAVAYVVHAVADGERPVLAVRGTVLGAMHDGKLVSPINEAVFPKPALLEPAAYEAAEVAAGLLDAELAHHGPATGAARVPAGAAWSRQQFLDALGPRRGGWIEQEAARARGALGDAPSPQGQALGDWSLARLKLERDRASDPFARLDREGALRALTLERQQAETGQRIAAEPASQAARHTLARLERELSGLQTSGTHPDRWMQRLRWEAVTLLALERELESRAAALARDGSAGHLLEHYRGALGGRRLAALAERTQAHADASGTLTDRQLHRRRDELAERLKPAGGELNAAHADAHADQRLDAWLDRWGDAAAERVALQAEVNRRARERQLGAEAGQAAQAAPQAAVQERAEAREPAGMEL